MTTISKRYHFHAAHRNPYIDGKCQTLHGHTYRICVEIQVPQKEDGTGVTIEFSEIDKHIEPIIEAFDHALLIDDQDPLLKVITEFGGQKLVVFNCPTSAENLAEKIAMEIITTTPLLIHSVSVQETTSSTVTIYV